MRSYLITIIMGDGSLGQHHGLYADGFAAINRALDLFPTAKSISARRLA